MSSTSSRTGTQNGSAAGSRGLYGSAVGERTVRAAVAELVGTAVLVYAGTATAVASLVQPGAGVDVTSVALAFGFVLVALVAALGHVSGCHLNPAVTVALAATRRFPWRYVGTYVGAQLVGGLVGSLATWVTYGDQARTVANLAATVPADGVSQGRALLVEALITFVLVLVVVPVATDERVPAALAPLAVGLVLGALVLLAAPVTGGAVNPARAFGPAVLAGEVGPLWLYLLGPLAGGVLAAALYDRVLERAAPPD